MSEPVAGKFLLEILTKGMYSNPMHIYREYIQNATDAIDAAVQAGLIQMPQAAIHITVNTGKRSIIIRDNGTGISSAAAVTRLLNIGASDKDGIAERGFRGIGRLGGLAYADEVRFITSAVGESIKTIIDSEEADDYARFMLDHEEELTPIIEKYRGKSAKSRYLDFNQGIDGRRINDENMAQLARLAIRPLRIAFDDIKLKDVYCNAVRTAFRHGIKEISNYILFNYLDKPEDLYERLRINIDLNKELGIQIFSFPMRFSPIDRTDRSHIGVHWKYRKYLRAISAILQVTKGVVAAGSSFFEAAFGKTQEEYFEILAMPREMIIHRYYYRDNGTTAKWRELYCALTEEQKDRLMQMVSCTVGELRSMPCPDEFKDIFPFYLLKYSGEQTLTEDLGKQLSLLNDADTFDEE